MNLQDRTFLKTLDDDRNKSYYARVIVLDDLDRPLKSIEGRVLPDSSVSINGKSNIRRTCNINLVAEEKNNDLDDIDNLLSINKKIKIAIGIEKSINYASDIYYFEDKSSTIYDVNFPFNNGFPTIGEKGKIYVDRKTETYWVWNGRSYQEIKSLYDYNSELVWFPLGVYVIAQPSLSHTTSGCNISLSCKDKMCLLNGEMGGNLPTSVTFHEYNQIIGELKVNYDPRTSATLEPNNYTIYNYNGKYYAWSEEYGWKETSGKEIGETVNVPQLIYDIIQTAVINYGGESPSRIIINDVPTEIKQIVRYVGNAPLYHNTETGQYTTNELYLTESGVWKTFNFNEDVGYTYTSFTFPGSLVTNIGDNVCTVLDKIKNTLGNYEYFYDIDGNFVFQEIKNYLNTSYDATEKANEVQTYYLDNNRKSDVVIKNNSLKILGKENYKVDKYGDQKSIYTFEEGSGLISSYNNNPSFSNIKNDYHIWGKNNQGLALHYHLVIKEPPTEFQEREVVFLTNKDGDKYTGKIRLPKEGETGIKYMPNDWRAELYLQGLEIAAAGGRPDIYQQELLDLFDIIYEWGYYNAAGAWVPEGRFKSDITRNPNGLTYFIDYLEPTDNLYDISVDNIKTKISTKQQDKIIKMYNVDIPNYILIDESMDNNYELKLMNKCDEQGQPHSVIDKELYKKIAIGTAGYTAQEVAREMLYQSSSYNESISLSCIPIYYLDVNKRITVKDKKANINGDYIINSITLPLAPSSTMNISASRALNRI